ncbi:hypothetical protein ABZ153_42415 [Streptomyces sp. NPDC006290]|uniref:hypothetical protein n=1 Tax=Streptomyces sp. NPDC006290 TaxID=3156745 RepID=UPI0033BC580E
MVDKEYAAAAKVIDLLLEEKEHAEGRNLYERREARRLTRTLALEGPRALRGSQFQELMSAFVMLASQRGTSRQDEALSAFVTVLEQAWAASTRRAVTELLARIRRTRDYAAALHKDPVDPKFPQLDPPRPHIRPRPGGHPVDGR